MQTTESLKRRLNRMIDAQYPLPKIQRERVLMYLAGSTLEEIATRYNVTRQAISAQFLRTLGQYDERKHLIAREQAKQKAKKLYAIKNS